MAEEQMATSPVIRKPEEKGKKMNFGEALIEATKGKRITKLEWQDKNTYGFMQGTILYIHVNNENHVWKISEGDILGDDYVII